MPDSGSIHYTKYLVPAMEQPCIHIENIHCMGQLIHLSTKKYLENIKRSCHDKVETDLKVLTKIIFYSCQESELNIYYCTALKYIHLLFVFSRNKDFKIMYWI